MSAERAERIRMWHEAAYEAAKQEAASGQTFDYMGRTIVVPPEVQPIAGMSHPLGEAVLAVDISPHAIAAAQANAVRNHVADLIEVRQRMLIFSWDLWRS
jgi:release factor glutamine methyltransferase